MSLVTQKEYESIRNNFKQELIPKINMLFENWEAVTDVDNPVTIETIKKEILALLN